MLTTILSVAFVVAGLGAVLALVVVPLLPDRARDEEDEARAFLERHGRWPDEG